MTSDDVDSLYRDGMRRKAELEALFEKFEQSPNPNDVATQQKLSFLAREFSQVVERLEERTQQLKGSARTLWERKTGRLSDDCRDLKNALDQRLGRMFQVQREEENRKALFGDRSNKKQDDTQDLVREHRKLQESNQMLDNVLEQGRDVLRSIGVQNKTIKNARRKLLDAANIMGLASSLVNVIDRRHTMDKWLVYLGMVISLLLLFGLYWLRGAVG